MISFIKRLLGLHNWSVWQNFEIGDIQDDETDKLSFGVYVIQDRFCYDCGLIEYHSSETILSPKEHKHDWTLWETYDKGPIICSDKENAQIGSYIEQKRSCTSCGLIELNTAKTQL